MYVKPIVWTIAASVVLILGTSGLAAVTGLASGRVSETEVPVVFVIMIGSLIAFDVAVAVLGGLGMLLTIALFKKGKTT